MAFEEGDVTWKKRILGGGNHKCKGPEVGVPDMVKEQQSPLRSVLSKGEWVKSERQGEEWG